MKISELIRSIESRPIGDGDRLGEPFRLLKYQKQFLRSAFREGIVRSALTLARGGGKTGLASALALEALLPDSPLHCPGFECVVIASSFQQATICGRAVKTSLELLGKKTEGKDREYRVRDSQNIFDIENMRTHARFKVYGSDSKRAHGLRPNLVIADEPAQWELGGERLAAALRTALGKRKNARMLAIGTRPDAARHWFARMLDEKDTSVSQMVFAAPRSEPWDSERTWHLANPALAEGFPDIETLRAEARIAKRDSQELASFKALRLNQGTRDIEVASLLDPEAWNEAETVELPPRQGPFALGLDLGGVAAFCAAAAFWPHTGRLEGFQACGGDLPLGERGKRDRVNDLYELMETRGELVILGQARRTVEPAEFLKECLKRFGRPDAIAADRYKEGELSDAARETGIAFPVPNWRGQGWRDGGIDVRAFKTLTLEGKVHAPVSLAMRAAFTEARVQVDNSGNEKLAKGSEAGRRQLGRDDLAAAIILSVAEGSRMKPRKRAWRYRGM